MVKIKNIWGNDKNWKGLTICSVILGIILLIVSILNVSIWEDEAFTIGTLRYPFKDIINVTAMDVHPPLFYLIMKPVYLLTNSMTVIHQLIVLRLFNCLPIIGMIYIMYRVLHMNGFNKEKAMFFSSLIPILPHVALYSAGLRMYPWAALFVLLTYFAALKYLDTKNMIWLFSAAIGACLAAYTHYFSAVMVGLVFLYMIGYSIFKRNYSELRNILLSCIFCVFTYLPWLYIAFAQISEVKGNYWIPPIGFSSLLSFFAYPFTPGYNMLSVDPIMVAILSAIITIAMLIITGISLFSWFKETKGKSGSIQLALIVFVGTIIFGTVLSITMKPIFINRYLYPTLIPVTIGIILMISELGGKKRSLAVIYGMFLVFSAFFMLFLSVSFTSCSYKKIA